MSTMRRKICCGCFVPRDAFRRLLKATQEEVTAVACFASPSTILASQNVSKSMESPTQSYTWSIYAKVVDYEQLKLEQAMESFPEKISLAVYVSTFMPNLVFPQATLVQEYFERTPKESLLDFHFSFDRGPEDPPTCAVFGPNNLAANVYQQCQAQDLKLAKMLVKPSNLYLQDLAAESLLTEEKFGSVSQVFILSEKDELLKPDFRQWMIGNSPPKEVKSLAGADDMAMLSKHDELSLCLQEIAEKYC